LLTIAVIKPDGAEIRISTFSGPEIESLEQGTCRPVP